jgi:hypothetical protein
LPKRAVTEEGMALCISDPKVETGAVGTGKRCQVEQGLPRRARIVVRQETCAGRKDGVCIVHRVNDMKKPILIIEDNEQTLYLLTFILKKYGYDVVQARDGREGVELADRVLPMLILLEGHGYEVAMAINGSRRWSSPDVTDQT